MEEAKEWNISPSEIQTSFDVVNLYPSVPIDEAVAVIIEILNNDINDLQKRTKLTLTDIHKLIELCLSTNYFIFDNRVRILKNRSDWFSINGCDIRSFPTAFGK